MLLFGILKPGKTMEPIGSFPLECGSVGKITVLVLFLFAGKYDKLAILVNYIDASKTAFLHPAKLHREFLVLIKRVPPV